MGRLGTQMERWSIIFLCATIGAAVLGFSDLFVQLVPLGKILFAFFFALFLVTLAFRGTSKMGKRLDV